SVDPPAASPADDKASAPSTASTGPPAVSPDVSVCASPDPHPTRSRPVITANPRPATLDFIVILLLTRRHPRIPVARQRVEPDLRRRQGRRATRRRGDSRNGRTAPRPRPPVTPAGPASPRATHTHMPSPPKARNPLRTGGFRGGPGWVRTSDLPGVNGTLFH